MTGTSSSPAGWYKDPADAERMRWWDGREWSEDVRPRGTVNWGSPPPTKAGSSGPGPHSVGASGQGGAPAHDRDDVFVAPDSEGPSRTLPPGSFAGAGLVALAVLIVGLVLVSTNSTAAHETARATGSIAFRSIFGSRNGNCSLVADFQVNGQLYQANGFGSCSMLGKSVTVRYDPSQPSEASFGGTVVPTWVFELIVIAGGVLLVAVVVAGTVNHVRLRRAKGASLLGWEHVPGPPTTW